MNDNTKCLRCGSTRLVLGTLEGVSFVPKATDGKFLSKGVYGITAQACLDCGGIEALALDTKALERLVKK